MDLEREEGELTEEELEDVSDSSISLDSLFFCEKICRVGSIRELSLTSVSDESSDDLSVIEVRDTKATSLHKLPNLHDKYNKHRKFEENYSQKRPKNTKNRYRSSRSGSNRQYSRPSSSSSDSEEYLSNKKILRQLRDAVRISSTKKNPNCSLRTRIKRMIEPDSPNIKKSEDEDLDNLRDQALKSKSTSLSAEQNEDSTENNSAITDEDLINLRLIALQSAVLKKHENRRKRKEQEMAEVQKEFEKSSDKVNAMDEDKNINADVENNKDELVNTNIASDDKSNVKMTQDDTVKSEHIEKPASKTTPEEDEDILRAMLLTSISQKISNKRNGLPISKEVKKIKMSNKSTNSNKPPLTSMANKPKIPVKRLVINVNSDSESDCNTQTVVKQSVSKIKLPPDCFEQDLSKFLKEARIKSEVQQQSDISKHLPRSQQIEYRRLKRKLQQLSKQNLHLKYKKSNVDENKHIKHNIPTDNKITSIKKPLNYKLDRLQIKGKYETLGPLMATISKSREARETAQNDVKRLINELKEARTRLTTTHRTYTVLIQQLQDDKAELDARTNVLRSSENKEVKKTSTVTNVCTSTPLKENLQGNVCDISTIWGENVKIAEEPIVQKEELINVAKEIKLLPEGNSLTIEIEKNDEIKEDIVSLPDKHVDIAVDNRISEDLMKYNSPLEHIQSNSEQYVGNPLSVLCPYDLLGVCRDPDCSYRH